MGGPRPTASRRGLACHLPLAALRRTSRPGQVRGLGAHARAQQLRSGLHAASGRSRVLPLLARQPSPPVGLPGPSRHAAAHGHAATRGAAAALPALRHAAPGHAPATAGHDAAAGHAASWHGAARDAAARHAATRRTRLPTGARHAAARALRGARRTARAALPHRPASSWWVCRSAGPALLGCDPRVRCVSPGCCARSGYLSSEVSGPPLLPRAPQRPRATHRPRLRLRPRPRPTAPWCCGRTRSTAWRRRAPSCLATPWPCPQHEAAPGDGPLQRSVRATRALRAGLAGMRCFLS
jgi:hypothetical protein